MRRDEREARELFERELDTIRRVIRVTCRNRRLDTHEAEDFESYVMLKLIEDDYRRLRKFKGTSKLSTFLTTVVQRLFLDTLIAKRGKWRPSAQARALGETAVELERLIDRDGLSFDEARAVLQTGRPNASSAKQLQELSRALPPRMRRPKELSLDLLEQLPGEAFVDPVNGMDVAQNASVVAAKLASAIERLGEEDRLLLKLRFAQRLPARRIGLMLGRTQSQVYDRVDRVIRTLRADLERDGVRSGDVKEVLQWGQFELDWTPVVGGVDPVS